MSRHFGSWRRSHALGLVSLGGPDPRVCEPREAAADSLLVSQLFLVLGLEGDFLPHCSIFFLPSCTFELCRHPRGELAYFSLSFTIVTRSYPHTLAFAS